MSQRLVRRSCSECLEQYEPAPELLAEWFETPPDVHWRREHGCRACHNTGYSGRLAVAELWVPSASDAVLIRRRASNDEIREEALKRMPSLGEDALLKAMQGKTSLEEAARVAPWDDVRLVRERGAERVLAALDGGEGEDSAADGSRAPDRLVA
jgi:type II secretory ATPase GspE/PulE/Tfp pilus assembly ATPase PilB-like protein